MSDGNPIIPQMRRDPYRLVGELFDKRYRIEAFVSSGSFGAVYRAVDTRLNKAVAVKILKPDLKEDLAETARELFQREALTAGRLDHPHIVNVTDVGEEFDFAYMVMEWLEGRTLESEIKTRKFFTPEDAAKILSDIADALHTAHEQGVIHRDIKPSNIHLGKEEKTRVKVLDFGIAKVITSASQAMASRIAGTLEYASPEQISGGMIDRSSDIYSLGVLMFQMLTGELPFKANSEAHLIQMHLMEPPPKLSEKRNDLPEQLSTVIERAMAKQPEDRFQSALDFRQAFVDSFSQQKPVDPPEMKTLLAETIASPLETETQNRIKVPFVSDLKNLQTDISKPKDTQETKLQGDTQEKQLEQATPTRGKRYALRYALGGAIFMLVFRFFFWQEIDFKSDIKMEVFFAVDIPCGVLMGIILSEMRPSAWWSVAKHRRLKAFVIYALTGAAVLYGGVWLLFHYNFFFLKWAASMPYSMDVNEYYVSECHSLINLFVPVLIPIGIVVGLAICGIRIALSNETKDSQDEITSFAADDKSRISIYLILGCAILSFIISLVFCLILRNGFGFPASSFRVIHDTIFGAAFGAIIWQLLRPSTARWSVTDGYHGKSILLHGFTSVFVIQVMEIPQRIFTIFLYSLLFSETGSLHFSILAEPAHSRIYFVAAEFFPHHYSPHPVFLFRAMMLGFTVGVIVWSARVLAHRTKRPGLIYTLCGLLCSFVLSWIEILPDVVWLPYCLLNILIGTMFFASVSELRRDALWSVAKGHRVKSFLVHGATGITVVMGVGWLFWYFNILTVLLKFHSPSVYILLAILALIGFILGLVVCGVRIAIQQAMLSQK
jgi:serine/threonine protein kinase